MHLTVTDLAIFVYSGLIAAVVLACFGRIPDAGRILGAHVAVTGAAAALIACAARCPGRGWRIARDWYPLGIVPAAFRELSYLIPPVRGADWHAELMAWDRALFGTPPTILLERLLHPLAVEALQLCYASFYALPVILGVVLYTRRPREEYREGVALVILAFLSSYLGYFLFPARSPYFHDAALGHTRLWGIDPATRGYGFVMPIRLALESLELDMRDCFPSGHTEVTLVTLACAWRFHRATFWALFAPATGLLFSTLYLRYHYAVDVLAGAALAGLVLWSGPGLHRRWEAWKHGGGPAPETE